MKSALIASLVAAVVLMLWGAVYWTVLPFGYQVLQPVVHEGPIVKSLERSLAGTGVYMIPFLSQEQMQDPAAVEAMSAQHRQGPLVQIFYTKEGVEPMAPAVFIGGFLNFFTSALIVAALLTMALPGLRSYSQRALFVFLVGLFGGVAIDLARPIWWLQPWDYWIHQALFPITAWLLAGLVMAALIKPRPAAESAA